MTQRRTFLLATAAAAAAAQAQTPAVRPASAPATPPAPPVLARIRRPELPYAQDALAPVMSAETLRLHHGAHHIGYYDRMAALAAKRGWEGLNLEDMIRQSHGVDADLFNAAAQVYNHNLFWHSLRPAQPEPAAIPDDLARRIYTDFGSILAFKKALSDTALNTFGSGWAWLVADRKGALSLRSTSAAGTPLTEPGLRPLLTLDVWEHAYYVDYRNKRAAYLNAVIDQLLNWDFAAAQYRAV